MKVKKIKHFSIFVTNLLELQFFLSLKDHLKIWQLKKHGIWRKFARKINNLKKNPVPRILGYGWSAVVYHKIAI